MKRSRLIMLMAACLPFTMMACGSKQPETKTQEVENTETTNVLVAFFSATGTTKEAAEKVAEATGGELYEIEPKIPYTSDDLNWNDEKSRSTIEMKDPKARPALKSTKTNIADYTTVYIGYPNWWGVAPRIINTFIEKHDLKGKTIRLFSTSGGSGIEKSISEFKSQYPDLNFKDGKLLNGASESTVRKWVEGK